MATLTRIEYLEGLEQQGASGIEALLAGGANLGFAAATTARPCIVRLVTVKVLSSINSVER